MTNHVTAPRVPFSDPADCIICGFPANDYRHGTGRPYYHAYVRDPAVGLGRAVDDVISTFKGLGHVYNGPDMVALQLGQLAETVQHQALGQKEKEMHEWADQISIAWQSIRELGGIEDVEAFVVRRIREKVIPAARKSMEKYRLTEVHGAPPSE